MRMMLAFALLLGTTLAQAQTIDLNAPGALESLKQRSPDHYAKAQAILRLAETRPQLDLKPWIEARLDASDVELDFWRVSDPPQLIVAFTLGAARYKATVIPALAPPRWVPAH